MNFPEQGPTVIRAIVSAAVALTIALAPAAFANDADHTPGPAIGATDRAHMLVEHGMAYLGIRYRKGGTSPETGLDCSGLVRTLFQSAIGMDLPRTASEMARLGDRIALTDLRPGDLVFFDTMRRAFSHVGVYLGGGEFLHAPSSGGVVRVETLNKQYWKARFNGARRLLSAEG